MHQAPTQPTTTRTRLAYLDNLKVLLVTGIILGHAIITYADVGSWAYREPSQHQLFNLVATTVVALGSLFAMGLFFLISGLLTPGPVARKGPGAFLRDRALRLGAPFLAYLMFFPALAWLGAHGQQPIGWFYAQRRSYWDPGPLWFVAVLFMFSAAYVGWRSVRPRPAGASPMPRGVLPIAVAAITIGSILVRVRFPIDSYQLFAAHVWQWPQCITLFVLGIAAAERGWLNPIPVRLRRAGGRLALGGIAIVLVAMGTASDLDPFTGGLSWQAALTAACEGMIAVGLSLWLPGTFQHHFNTTGRLGSALGRAAFGAYVIQAPILVTISLLARDLPVAPEVKFFLVAPAAITASFGIAWLLTRAPGLRRVL